MSLSPIFGLLAVGGHDCFCTEFRALAPEPEIRQTTTFRVGFGVKEDSNRVSRRTRKGKSAVPKPQLFYFIILRLAEGAEALQLVRHELELAFLFQAVVQGGPKGLKCQISLGLEELVGQLLLLFVEIGWIGFRLFGHAIDQPVLSHAQGNAYIASLQVEGRANLFAAGRAGDGTVARDGITCFWLQAESAGGGIKFLTRLDAPDQVLRFALGHRLGLFAL